MNGITPQQATYVIDRLLAARQITTTDIKRYLEDIKGEIRAIEERIAILRTTAPLRTTPRSAKSRVASSVASNTAASNATASNTTKASTARSSSRPSRRLSPKKRAALQLQGSYLGYMRQVKAKDKARFVALRTAKGFAAAITALRKHLKK